MDGDSAHKHLTSVKEFNSKMGPMKEANPFFLRHEEGGGWELILPRQTMRIVDCAKLMEVPSRKTTE
jgi:hypothetical protein